MLPGMNSKQMKQMMKQMGIEQEDVDATEVIIRTGDTELVFSNPQVSKIEMRGQETYQIVGSAEERAADQSVEISDDDIETVVEQTGASEDEARDAIEEADGDLAEAIMSLQE